MAPPDDGFLGQGWNFQLPRPALANEQEVAAGVGLATATVQGVEYSPIAEASGEEKIRQSIWLILSTSQGERIGRPDFGCGLHDLVFATRTANTLGEASRTVTSALQRWEPRIALLGVDARYHPSDPNGILIEIRYEVRATNSRFNLVYPFYLST